jgi:hypothetical protein
MDTKRGNSLFDGKKGGIHAENVDKGFSAPPSGGITKMSVFG